MYNVIIVKFDLLLHSVMYLILLLTVLLIVHLILLVNVQYYINITHLLINTYWHDLHV